MEDGAVVAPCRRMGDAGGAASYDPPMARKRKKPTLISERRLLVPIGVAGALLLAFLIWVSA